MENRLHSPGFLPVLTENPLLPDNWSGLQNIHLPTPSAYRERERQTARHKNPMAKVNGSMVGMGWFFWTVSGAHMPPLAVLAKIQSNRNNRLGRVLRRLGLHRQRCQNGSMVRVWGRRPLSDLPRRPRHWLPLDDRWGWWRWQRCRWSCKETKETQAFVPHYTQNIPAKITGGRYSSARLRTSRWISKLGLGSSSCSSTWVPISLRSTGTSVNIHPFGSSVVMWWPLPT